MSEEVRYSVRNFGDLLYYGESKRAGPETLVRRFGFHDKDWWKIGLSFPRFSDWRPEARPLTAFFFCSRASEALTRGFGVPRRVWRVSYCTRLTSNWFFTHKIMSAVGPIDNVPLFLPWVKETYEIAVVCRLRHLCETIVLVNTKAKQTCCRRRRPCGTGCEGFFIKTSYFNQWSWLSFTVSASLTRHSFIDRPYLVPWSFSFS